MAQFETIQQHLDNGNTITYKIINGTAYHIDTPEPVWARLESARLNHSRVRLFYGDTDKLDYERVHGKSPDLGRDWGDEYAVTGYIERSTGKIKIPLLVSNRRSLGGGALLDDCIVRLIVNGREVYRHPNYHQPSYEVGNPGAICEGDSSYNAGVYADGDNVANFKSEKSARNWVDFMTGKRMSK